MALFLMPVEVCCDCPVPEKKSPVKSSQNKERDLMEAASVTFGRTGHNPFPGLVMKRIFKLSTASDFPRRTY
jgi:hypothetical protein